MAEAVTNFVVAGVIILIVVAVGAGVTIVFNRRKNDPLKRSRDHNA